MGGARSGCRCTVQLRLQLSVTASPEPAAPLSPGGHLPRVRAGFPSGAQLRAVACPFARQRCTNVMMSTSTSRYANRDRRTCGGRGATRPFDEGRTSQLLPEEDEVTEMYTRGSLEACTRQLCRRVCRCTDAGQCWVIMLNCWGSITENEIDKVIFTLSDRAR